MKKTTLLSATLVAALCVAPLAACGGGTTTKIKVNGKPFSVADHAAPVSMLPQDRSGTFLNDVPDEVELSDVGYEQLAEDSVLNRIVRKPAGSGTYTLYNAMTGKDVSTTAYAATILQPTGSDGRSLIAATTDNNGSNASKLYDAYAPTGEFLFTYHYSRSAPTIPVITEDHKTFTLQDRNGDTQEETSYYCMSYYASQEDRSSGNKTLKYYRYTIDHTDYANNKWETIDEDTFNSAEDPYEEETASVPTQGKPIDVRTNLLAFALNTSVEGLDDVYTENALFGWNISVQNTKIATIYTFWKDNERKSTISLNKKFVTGPAAFTDNYMYYIESLPVSQSATDGFNYQVGKDKYDVSLYRFDFMKGGEPKEIDTNYAPAYVTSYYNYTTNSFDAIGCSAYAMNNGVAVADPSSGAAAAYTLILDEDGKVSADLSAKKVVDGFYKLSDTRILAVGKHKEYVYDPTYGYSAPVTVYDETICDENLDVIATLPTSISSPVIDEVEKVILTATVDLDNLAAESKVMFIDYDGKLVYNVFENAPNVMNGTAFTIRDHGVTAWQEVYPGYNNNRGAYDYCIYNADHPEGVMLSDLIRSHISEKATHSYRLCKFNAVFLLETEDNATSKHNIKVFDLSGTKIAEYDNLTVIKTGEHAYFGYRAFDTPWSESWRGKDSSFRYMIPVTDETTNTRKTIIVK